MNLNINNISVPSPNIGGLQPPGETVAQTAKERAPAASSLTITQTEVPRNEISVSEMPDDAFDRRDELGKIVNAVFNLPPPQMPVFTG